MSEKIRVQHLARKAVLYVRQSSVGQDVQDDAQLPSIDRTAHRHRHELARLPGQARLVGADPSAHQVRVEPVLERHASDRCPGQEGPLDDRALMLRAKVAPPVARGAQRRYRHSRRL
jgi:hypothetical protein